MTPLTASILGGIACGIAMVVGGIFLLYKGAIELESASKDPALTVDLFKKQFSLSTRVPALGLFVIGLLFVGASMWVAMKTDVPRIPVVGEFIDMDEPINVTVHKEWSVASSQREVNDVLRPSFDVLWVKMVAPGYDPLDMSFSRDRMAGEIQLGKVTLKRAIPKIEPRPENIEPVNFPAPKFDPNAGGFAAH
jgi:F0F1-type ATP synthase membrane subunit c/vacuolar-type H+-ATPase subunit K